MERRAKSSLLSTTLEFYDFTIYAYLAIYIAPLFFPHKDGLVSLLLTYGVFALGFLVRPIGAYLFGGLGDKYGRKRVLVYTLLLMVCSTFVIGLLPTYQTIGIWAPIFLLLFRVMQGLSVGGEVAGSSLFAVESEKKYKCFIAAFVWSGSSIGILLGSVVVLIITVAFSKSEVQEFAWRIPFLLAVSTGGLGAYIRLRTRESLEFVRALRDKKIVRNPWLKLLGNYKARVLRIFCLYALCGAITYLIFVFMPVFAVKFAHVPEHLAVLSNTIAIIVMIPLSFLTGYLSDRFGPKIFLKLGAVLLALLGYPIYNLILLGGFSHLLMGQLLLAFIAAIYQGPIMGYVLSRVGASMRYSVSAVGYNLGYSVFGGISPFVAVYILKVASHPADVAFYLTLCACISLFGLFVAKS